MQVITITTLVNAPLTQAWTCFTDSAHIINWNFAADTWHCPAAANDLREGGTFSYTMAAKDGSFSFDFEGQHNTVLHHEYIASTLADGRKMSVRFAAQGEQTLVTETFEPESENPIALQTGGWQAILDNFKQHTEAV